MDEVITRIYQERLGELNTTMNPSVREIYVRTKRLDRLGVNKNIFQYWIIARFTAKYSGNIKMLKFENKYTNNM